MKLNLIGDAKGFAGLLAEQLWNFDCEAWVNSPSYDYFDATLVMGLWFLDKNLFKSPKVPVFAIALGTDIITDLEKGRIDESLLKKCLLTLIPDMAFYKKISKVVPRSFIRKWHMGYNDRMFHKDFPTRLWFSVYKTRDYLCYCPRPKFYKLDHVLHLAKTNPTFTFTVLGNALPNMVIEQLPNVLAIEYVPHYLMPRLYAMHKNFSLYTTGETGIDFGIMGYEALAMGLEVTHNYDCINKDKQPYMKSSYTIPKLLKILE